MNLEFSITNEDSLSTKISTPSDAIISEFKIFNDAPFATRISSSINISPSQVIFPSIRMSFSSAIIGLGISNTDRVIIPVKITVETSFTLLRKRTGK